MALYAFPVFADVNLPGQLGMKLGEAPEELTTAYEGYVALQEAADNASQVAIEGMATASGLAENVKDPSALVDSAVGAATTTVLGAVSNYLDGSSGEDEAMEAVQNTYTPSYNMPLPEVRKHYDELNKKAGEDLARLFARSLVLRQELMAEENPAEDFETIKEAQAASTALLIKSAQRWNKILEIQAYTDEFQGSKRMQNFKLDEEEADEEGNGNENK